MFFMRRSEPLALRPEWTHVLRVSLNSPVVSAEGLPVGPARAAVVVHDEPDGRPNVTIGVRSQKTGELVLYSYDGDLREQSSVSVGLDGALSFGETMGFLFDDDEIRGESALRDRAVDLWNQLIGEPAPPMKDDPQEPVLELIDEVDEAPPLAAIAPPDPAAWPDLAGRPISPLAAEPAVLAPALIDAAWPEEGDATEVVRESQLLLSKFRRGGSEPGRVEPRADAPVDASASPQEAPAEAVERPTQAVAAPARRKKRRGLRRAALGRVRLVKKRLGGAGAQAEARSWAQRFLTSF